MASEGEKLVSKLKDFILEQLRPENRRRLVGSTALVGVVLAWFLHRQMRKRKRLLALMNAANPELGKKKVAVNKQFLERLKTLVPIVLPGVKSKEFLLLALHTTFLISRTLVSIYVAKLDGSIVKSIVDKRPNKFAWLMVKWLLVALPATYINSMIRFLESKLSIAFRTRLVSHVYKMYMDSDTYYRVGNLDTRLNNPDQCLTEDVAHFCSELAHIYSQLSKPIFDIVLMTAQLVMLSRGRGAGNKQGSGNIQGASRLPGIMATSVIALTGVVLKLFTPPFGKMIAEEARRYGELRAVHARVITHAEEIAFYRGQKVELTVLQRAYNSLVKHMNKLYWKRVPYTMLEQFMMKYVWGACGMCMIAVPTFNAPQDRPTDVAAGTTLTATSGEEISNRTQDFVTARGLLISAADAIERMMSSWKEITELAGRTERVADMINIFQQVKEGKYQKSTVAETKEKEQKLLPRVKSRPKLKGSASKMGLANADKSGKGAALLAAPQPAQSLFGVHLDAKQLEHHGDAEDDIRESPAEKEARLRRETQRKAKLEADKKIAEGMATVYDNQKFVKLVNVPVVTPNGDVLVSQPPLTFEVQPGMHLLITGPNGCGKSSLFRMIGGLWPVRGKAGTMYKPSQGDMFYIPQRPYLTAGCLREQFIYPHTREDMKARGFTDEDLNKLADVVNLRYVVQRQGGWDAVDDWRDVLSGGEKQRVGMARVFYHKPLFAILDECTSAVSIDVEGQMYSYAKHIGITLMTVTHRPTLWKYHTHLLQFDGQGGWKFSELNADARLSLQDEKTKIEAQLAGLPKVQERLQELCALLGESSIHLKKLEEAAVAASKIAPT